MISHIFPDGSQKAFVHSARSLTPAKQNYRQIEKEALAIIFVIKKFYKMFYGRMFTSITDHKPLVTNMGTQWKFESWFQ